MSTLQVNVLTVSHFISLVTITSIPDAKLTKILTTVEMVKYLAI